MKSYVKNLLSARAALVADFSKLSAQFEKRLGHLDALLQENEIDTARLPSVPKAAGVHAKGSGALRTTEKVTKAARGRQTRNSSGFNITGAVREVVAGMNSSFNIATLRTEFEKRHPGVLVTLNRIALSLAMQSLGRKGEVKTKKDPHGKGNLFSKTNKLKVL